VTPKGMKTRVTSVTVWLIVHSYSDKARPINNKAD